jgi:hypothetical protein
MGRESDAAQHQLCKLTPQEAGQPCPVKPACRATPTSQSSLSRQGLT